VETQPSVKPEVRPKYKHNIKLKVKEIGCKGVNWVMWPRIGSSDGFL